jgi:hypothetical protein
VTVVCPGVAEAVQIDNLQFFHDELATPVGQTRAQQVRQQAIDGHSAPSNASDAGGTASAFFLHKIQAEVRRRHDDTQPWQSMCTAITASIDSSSSTSSAVAVSLPLSSDSPLCSICLVPCSSSSHIDGACRHVDLTMVECPHCCATMTPSQLATHVQPSSVFKAQIAERAHAAKLTLPADWHQQPDRPTCVHDAYYQHFAAYQFPYPPVDLSSHATPPTQSSNVSRTNSSTVGGSSNGSGGASAPHISSAALNALADASLRDPTSNSAIRRQSSVSGVTPVDVDTKAPNTSRRNSAVQTYDDMKSSTADESSSHAVVSPPLRVLPSAFDHDDMPMPLLEEDDAHISGGDNSGGLPVPMPITALPPAASVAGEEFPPNCEACMERIFTFTGFLHHMGSCPALM